MRNEYKKDYVGTLEKENSNLKSLLEEVMDTSCLDDMIDDGCKDRDDDEFLGHNLILRSRIDEALGLSEAQKEVIEIQKKILKRDAAELKAFTGYSNTSVTAAHYAKLKPLVTEEPIKFTNSNKPIKIREN